MLQYNLAIPICKVYIVVRVLSANLSASACSVAAAFMCCEHSASCVSSMRDVLIVSVFVAKHGPVALYRDMTA